MVKEKVSVRYYAKDDWDKLIRLAYRGSKEVPRRTRSVILKSADIRDRTGTGKKK